MTQTKRANRYFTAEQKFNILKAIEADVALGMTQGAAVEKAGIATSVFAKWRKQLAVGVKSSLRSGKPLVDKDKKRLEREIERLKSIVVSQSQQIADLKKETNWE
jgi:transposase-like protein